MFCPKCGNKKVVDIFCADCLKEEKPLVSSFKEFKAEVCSGCGKVRFRGKWQENDSPKEQLEKDFADQLVIPHYATVERVEVVIDEIPLKDGLKVPGEATVRVHGKASDEAKSYVEEYVVPYEVQNKHCRPCSKEGTQYFEGTLQVRNEDEERKKFVLDTLHRFKGGIMKEVRIKKKCTDYFVTSNTAIQRSAHAIQDKYGGVVKSSAHIWGHDHQRSKDLFRETWYIEMPPFYRGEAVKYNKELLFIIDLGKKIRFYSPTRGKYAYHEFKQNLFETTPVYETTIAATHPEVTIIHPETFQAVKAWNAKLKEHEPGDQVKVVVDGEKAYIYEVVK